MNELNIDKAKLLDMFKGEDCRINWAASPAQGASHDAQGHEIRLQQSQAKLDDCLGQYLPALDLNQVALPAVYDEARRALERCIEPAEPHAIADQGAVLAAWAKRAKYPELESLAMRVRCHAIRKCGKLLLTYRAPGYRTDLAPPDGTSVTRPPEVDSPPRSQAEAGRKAGLSNDQIKQAVAVAKLPQEEFERHVDRPGRPATIEELLRGSVSEPSPNAKLDAMTFQLTALTGQLGSLVDCSNLDAENLRRFAEAFWRFTHALHGREPIAKAISRAGKEE